MCLGRCGLWTRRNHWESSGIQTTWWLFHKSVVLVADKNLPNRKICGHRYQWAPLDSGVLYIVVCVRVCVCACVHSVSLVQLFVAPWTVAHKTPLSMEFSRQEHWSGLPFPPPGDLPNPGIKLSFLMCPVLAGGFFTTGKYLPRYKICLQWGRPRSDPWVRMIPWRRAWLPLQHSCL